MAYVYLLYSLKDLKHYIGSTPTLGERFAEHEKGQVKSTKYRRPLKLKGYRETTTLGEARVLEHTYKRSHDTLARDIKKGLFKMIE